MQLRGAELGYFLGGIIAKLIVRGKEITKKEEVFCLRNHEQIKQLEDNYFDKC